MAPPAAIVFPTRGRRDYLAVALASVSSQARERGAEILVVHDEPPDARTEELATRHGARYLAHGQTRGLNAARNTAIATSTAPLICFLDDDVEAWPGWLDAILDAAGRNPEHAVLGGPIRARLEGTNLHACGREPAPITTLDLGPRDVDADFVWGANLTVRRSAVEEYGPFDPGLDLYGDEEDWLRRARGRGARIRYVARAGVDHRKAGADARLGALARGAYARGRASRRYDARKGAPPTLARELRTLAGTAAHTVRFRCGNGIVMSAHTAGRIREALRPAAPDPARVPNWLSGTSGTLNRRTALTGMATDAVVDVLLLPRRLALHRAAAAMPRRRVLVLSIARPERAGSAAAAAQELERSHHEVQIRLVAPHAGAGKWQNLNRALAASPPDDHDWLLVVDDDVVLPHGFLDPFLFLCERFGFTLAQPAHKRWSNAAWPVTRRRPAAVARRTHFVEIGPVTAVHRRAFERLLPFPDLHMGWGLDAHWSALAAEHGWDLGIVDATAIRHTRPVAMDYPRDQALAEEHGWRVGIVDATAIRHTRPVAVDYPRERALEEARDFLASRPYVTRDRASRTVAAHRSWR